MQGFISIVQKKKRKLGIDSGVLESLWKPHKSKDLTFLHRSYTQLFFSSPPKIFFSRLKKYFEIFSRFFFQNFMFGTWVSYVAQIAKCPINYAQYFFLAAVLRFKLPWSFWNRFKTILLDQEVSFKKIPSKKIVFSGRKSIFKKKVGIFFRIFLIRQKFRKIKIFEKSKKSDFSKISIFQKK